MTNLESRTSFIILVSYLEWKMRLQEKELEVYYLMYFIAYCWDKQIPQLSVIFVESIYLMLTNRHQERKIKCFLKNILA